MDKRPFVPTEWTRRIVRSWSIARGQRHRAGCGRFLPLAWTGELCRACQDAGRVPRPPEKRRHA